MLTDKDELIENLKQRIVFLENKLGLLKDFNKPLVVDAETQYESITLADEFQIYKENNEKPDYSIADMIRETSETYLSTSGYSYDEKTGLYFHSSSGYYYDPNNMLFYDPKNGIYYSYDADTQEYKYHSQDNIEELKKLNNQLVWSQGYQHKPPVELEICSNAEKSKRVPCIRLINEQTGELNIITCSGGSLGVDRNINHTVFLSNKEAVDTYLKIDYDEKEYSYRIYREESDSLRAVALLGDMVVNKTPIHIDHHSKLVINDHSYLLHIHTDNATCNWCEPGQVRDKLSTYNKIENDIEPILTKTHGRRVVDHLKVKYGLKGGNAPKGFWRKPSTNNKSKYIDRSLLRRNKEKEDMKIEEANHRQENIGAKMMLKMGWNVNEPIGLSGTGLREPIDVYQRVNARAGIGCDEALNVHIESDPRQVQKIKTRNALLKRYKTLFPNE